MSNNSRTIKIAFPNSVMIRLINVATETSAGSVSGYIRELVFEDLMKRSVLTKGEYEIMKELAYPNG